MRYCIAAFVLLLGVTVIASSARADLEVAWRYALDSEMFASPTALGGVAGYGPAAVVTGKQGLVLALDSQGSLLWRCSTPGRAVAPAAVADMDGDALPEVVVGDQSGTVSCLSCDGQLLWQVRMPGEVMWAWPAIADLDGDGKGEVVIGDSAGYLTCLRSGGELLWRVQTDGSFGSGPAIGDLNGDGSPEVVIGSQDRLLCLDAQGNWLWERQFGDSCESAPVLADLEGDGRMEIIVGTGRLESHLYVLDGVTSEVRWRFKTEAGIDSSIAAADLDGDGLLEVVFGDDRAVLRCLTARGEERWRFQFEGSAAGSPRLPSAPAVGDVDGDGRPEIVAAAHDGTEIVVLDTEGAVEARQELPSGSNGSPLLMPSRDGKVLIVSPTYRAKEVFAFWAGGTWRDEAMLWPAVRLTSAMTACLPSPAVARREFARLSAPSPAGVLEVTAPRDLQVGWNEIEVGLPEGAAGRLLMADIKAPSGAQHRACLRLAQDKSRARVRFEALDGGRYDLQFRLVRLPVEVEAFAELGLTLAPFQALLLGAEQALPRLRELQRAMVERNLAVARGLGARIALVEGFLAPLRQARGGFNGLSAEAKYDLLEQSESARHELERLTALAALLDSLPAEQLARQVLAWPAENPWDQFDPEAIPPVERLSEGPVFNCLAGEYESGAVNLLNLGDEAVGVRVEAAAPQQGGVQALPLEALQVRQVVAVPTSTKTMSSDALEELGSGNVVMIPPGRARQVWLTVRSRGLAAGEYAGAIRLQPLTLVPGTRFIPMSVSVAPVGLPEKMPVALCTWSNENTGGPGRRSYVLSDLVAHYNDVFVLGLPVSVEFDAQGNLVGDIDWSAHDKVLDTYKGLGQMLIPGALESLRWAGEGEPPEGAWEQAYAKWLRLWIAHMQERGWDYDTWAFYPVDEPGIRPGSAEELLRAAQRVKAIDPKARMYTDPVAEITPDELRKLAPYIDIWMPNLGFLLDATENRGDAAEKIAFIRSLGKTMWTYSPVGRAKTQHPTRVYRMHFWQALLRGLTGVGFWTYYYETPDIDPWKGPTDLSGKPASVEYAIVYASGDHMVASKRWEAIREGVEDCGYLYLLRDMVAQCEQRGIAGTDVEAVRELAASAAHTVLDSGMDDAVLADIRQQCIAALTRLQALLEQ